jgi:PAS domain S-box-containing protein
MTQTQIFLKVRKLIPPPANSLALTFRKDWIAKKRDQQVAAAAAVLACAVLLADYWVPLRIGVGVLYAAVVLLSLWSSYRHFVFVAAITGTVLINLGFFISPSDGPVWIALMNRVLSVGLLWLIVLLVPPYQRWRARTEAMRGHLAAIVESSDDAIISRTLDGTVLSWNRGAERVYGYMAEEIIGRSITMLVPPHLLDEEAHILERLQRGDHLDQYETVRVRKDGKLLDVSLTISPITDTEGRILGISMIARDVSQRRQAEEERDRLLVRLLDALDQIKTLRGMLPICAACRKIRNEAGSWEEIEVYIQQYSEVKFTHGLCPDCLKHLYPTLL